MSLASLWAMALAAAAARVLPHASHRRLVSLGVLAVAFGLGSAAVAGAGDPTLAAAGPVSRAIDGGFVIAGALLLIWTGIRAWSMSKAVPHGGVQPRLAAAVLIVIAMLLGWLARGLMVTAGIGADAAAAVVLSLGAGLASLIEIVSRRWPPRSDARTPTAAAPARWTRHSSSPIAITLDRAKCVEVKWM